MENVDTSAVTTLASFARNSNLQEIDLSKNDLSSIGSLTVAFTECNNLKKVKLPITISQNTNLDLYKFCMNDPILESVDFGGIRIYCT